MGSNRHAPLSPPGSRLIYATVLLSVIVLPLAGAAMAGRDLRVYLRFPPPLEIPTGYVQFSWLAAGAVFFLLGFIVTPWIVGFRRATKAYAIVADADCAPRRFPIWGWMSLGWTIAWWALAWTRLSWFEVLQPYTFFPLWLGFIVTINALTQRRTGTSSMQRAPRRWLALFLTSAACWWTFEWLNRFVWNWHYLQVQDFGPLAYFVHATLCFSTVLPAVAGVAEWLASYRPWIRRAAAGPEWHWIAHRAAAVALLAGGAIALFGTGVLPQWFYPALWVAPLAMLLGTSVLMRQPGVAHEVARGDWTRAATWMIAALICGFFWELWNWRSLAKWIYTVPGVERWFVFEMPLLGFAGYLPFGLECLLVSERLIDTIPRMRAQPGALSEDIPAPNQTRARTETR
jgi:hypothetical protein